MTIKVGDFLAQYGLGLDDEPEPVLKMEQKVGEFLAHYGVKGMRWGFSRSGNGTLKRNGGRAKGSDDHEKAQEIRRKRVSDMTNDELKVVTQRLQLEQSYARLNPKKVSKGKKFIENSIKYGQAASKTYNSYNEIAKSPLVNDLKKQLAATR